MRKRGSAYWEWADAELHAMQHSEILPGGAQIDVQSRLSRTGVIQMFIGVYARDGRSVSEQYFPHRDGERITEALAWGVREATAIASSKYVKWQ
ncbi:hypothetical protein ACI2KS_23775 [Pseudomonas sp. NPDC087358]|uniref:hypothetical protein n=1 Tax=Pseudomonas sp. NPDC087358 TaxID=3364439 RepID=UPI00384DCFEE